jgi:hypothetical protein
MTNVKELMKYLSKFDKYTPIALGIETENNMKLQNMKAAEATALNNVTGDKVEILIFLADNTNFQNN